MVGKGFEDTRNSIKEIIKIFKTDPVKIKNKEFEGIIEQIINFKSIKNFELFVDTFDFIINNRYRDISEYNNYLSKNLHNKNSNRAVKLYYTLLADGINVDETIKLVFAIYEQHLEMINYYISLFEKVKPSYEPPSFYFDLNNNIKFTRIKFDIFFSHRYYLKLYNYIIYYILTVYYGLIVYVDWIFDYSIDRKKLSSQTVKLLQYRMKQSNNLLFFNIKKSQTTSWMAWEVGYFSGLENRKIGILDLDGYCTGNKAVEVLSSHDILKYNTSLGIHVDSNKCSINRWV